MDRAIEQAAREEWEARRAEAAAMTATCDVCGAECEVHAQFHQATRSEPVRFLGFGAYCKGACFTPMGGGRYFKVTVEEAVGKGQ